jgi:hypothetical protein
MYNFCIIRSTIARHHQPAILEALFQKLLKFNLNRTWADGLTSRPLCLILSLLLDVAASGLSVPIGVMLSLFYIPLKCTI